MAEQSQKNGENPSSSGSGPVPVPASTSAEFSGSMSEYCKLLENWLTKIYWQRITAQSALSIMNPGFYSQQQQQQQQNGSINNNFIPQQQQQPQMQMPNGFMNPQANGGLNNNNLGAPNFNFINQGQGQNRPYAVFVRQVRVNGNRNIFDYTIAPLWKRLFAELLDFLILLVVKIFITLSIIDNFDIIDLNSIDLDAFQEPSTLYEVAFSLSSELILLELTHRLVVCLFEAYCLFKGGATPGKSMMGLRVISCDSVFPIVEPNRVNGVQSARILVVPGNHLTFAKALIRSVIKNFSLAFFFPLAFTLFHFEYNRSLYDLASKSIVVSVQMRDQ